jgi:wyosine [tRNA(Phe)-imidazoG37] synthetase (radical SAM superfamily)
MHKKKAAKIYRHIYGPVSSWRLGTSLGIDPVSKSAKVCSLDCVYCQAGSQKAVTLKRRVFIPTRAIISELESFPYACADYITLSGAGEPTLASNLSSIIRAVKNRRKEKIAVLTNSTLLSNRAVVKALMPADFVVAKLDAGSEDIFNRINRPAKGLNFKTVLDSIKSFRKVYKGKLALQIMFTSLNSARAEEIADIARDVGPDEVQINTPLRPCSAAPLSKNRILRIKKLFKGLNVITAYDRAKTVARPVDKKATLRRRGRL